MTDERVVTIGPKIRPTGHQVTYTDEDGYERSKFVITGYWRMCVVTASVSADGDLNTEYTYPLCVKWFPAEEQ